MSAPEPHPRRRATVVPLVSVDRLRRVRCRRYDACLNVAVEAGWRSWDCAGCKVLDDEPLTNASRDRLAPAAIAVGGIALGF